jgi:hypothetical protein
VRWYLRYSLSYRDLEEMMSERGLSVDRSTIARWFLRYAPILSQRIRKHCGIQIVLASRRNLSPCGWTVDLLIPGTRLGGQHDLFHAVAAP